MQHISLLVMSRLCETESAIFISFVYSLRPKNITILEFIYVIGHVGH